MKHTDRSRVVFVSLYEASVLVTHYIVLKTAQVAHFIQKTHLGVYLQYVGFIVPHMFVHKDFSLQSADWEYTGEINAHTWYNFRTLEEIIAGTIYIK